jgi:Ca2+-binding RTX toxin-like protein
MFASDADGDTLSVEDVTVSAGAIVSNGNGTWTYTPAPNDDGAAVFSYSVSDGALRVAQYADLDLVPNPPPGETDNWADPLAGTPANDVLVGTDASEEIDGRDGNDIIYAGTGSDLIFGGDGNDTIFAGAGDDIVMAGAGDDVVFGESGNDILLGETGNDWLFGGEGNDTVDGGDGNDRLEGDGGDDFVSGGTGNDVIVASLNDGDDYYDGGSDSDTLDLSQIHTGANIDLTAGTATGLDIGTDCLTGIENVIGTHGDDVITGNDAFNILTGGGGNDIFVFRPAEPNAPLSEQVDLITDFDVGDKIDVTRIDGDEDEQGQQELIYGGWLADDETASDCRGTLKYKYQKTGDTNDDEETVILVFNTADEEAHELVKLQGHHDVTKDYFNGIS